MDKRGDVWAFGVVRWEMLAGQRLFQGKTVSEVLAAVIRDEPDLSQVPTKVRPLLKRCLEKDPKRRLRRYRRCDGDHREHAGTRPASSRPVWALGAVAAVFAIAFAGVSFVHFRETPPQVRVITTSLEPPENTNFAFFAGYNAPALSPDGRRIVSSV